MFHIDDNFREGRPITQVPVSWFNSVARFLNNLVGGPNVAVEKPDVPSAGAPVMVKLADVNKANSTSSSYTTVVGGVEDGLTSTSAYVDVWGRQADYAKGLKIDVPTRLFRATTNGITGLYAAVRTLTFDGSGYLLDVSAEKNVTLLVSDV